MAQKNELTRDGDAEVLGVRDQQFSFELIHANACWSCTRAGGKYGGGGRKKIFKFSFLSFFTELFLLISILYTLNCTAQNLSKPFAFLAQTYHMATNSVEPRAAGVCLRVQCLATALGGWAESAGTVLDLGQGFFAYLSF